MERNKDPFAVWLFCLNCEQSGWCARGRSRKVSPLFDHGRSIQFCGIRPNDDFDGQIYNGSTPISENRARTGRSHPCPKKRRPNQ
jgi:hypothetical protein